MIDHLLAHGADPAAELWEAIQWAMVQIQPLLSRDLDVVVNGRDLGARLPRETILAPVRARGGAILSFNRAGEPSIQR